MKKVRIIIVIAALAIAFLSIWQNREPVSYEEKIRKEREEKNEQFLRSADSPLTEDQKKDFDSLEYFPVDESYRVTADIEEITPVENITVVMNDGMMMDYRKYGIARFSLKGEPISLIVLKDTKTGSFFIPFADATSGSSTYGAGRYIDPPRPRGNSIEIDFNKAYNPFCAYNESYQCPFPPKENVLSISINAGEKNFKN